MDQFFYLLRFKRVPWPYGLSVLAVALRQFFLTDNTSVCSYLSTDELSDELENAYLISVQVRPDGLSVSSINKANEHFERG